MATHWRTWGSPIEDYVTKDTQTPNRISAFIDLSGEGNDWIQDTGNNQPSWSDDPADLINGHPVAEFTTDEYVTCDALADLLRGEDTPFTLFIVERKNDNSAIQYIFSLGNAGSLNDKVHQICTDATPNYKIYRRRSTVEFVTESAGTPDTNPHYISHVFAGTTWGLWEDGVELVDPATAADVSSLAMDNCTIGAKRGSSVSNFLEGDIVEFALCTKALSTARKQAVEAYFASEYGI